MQLLTPQQSQEVAKLLWEGVDKVLWFFAGCIGLGVLHKLAEIKRILIKIVALPDQLADHTQDDRRHFAEINGAIRTEGKAVRKEIQSVMAKHISDFHGSAAD